jgi:hemerythrin-like domain-containing protein
MKEPLNILRHEHRLIGRVIRALDSICLQLQLGDQPPVEKLAAFVDFIQNFVNEFHHGNEDKYLMPMLQRQEEFSGGFALAAIENEHKLESELTKELCYTLIEYQRGGLEATKAFVGVAREYASHLMGHMQREDHLLFRVADDVLSSEDKATLMEQFTCARGDFGEERYQQYERISLALEDTAVF